MQEPRVIYRCAICGEPFERTFTGHGGVYIVTYLVNVCTSCYRNHPNGWPKEHEDKLTCRLRDRGLTPPPLNENGLFPRGI